MPYYRDTFDGILRINEIFILMLNKSRNTLWIDNKLLHTANLSEKSSAKSLRLVSAVIF